MKIMFTELTCAHCEKVHYIRPGQHMPYWLKLITTGVTFSSNHRQINCSFCSTECLSKAEEIINNHNKGVGNIHSDKEFELTICNQCGKYVKIDKLGKAYPNDPLSSWTEVQVSCGVKRNLCSKDCLKDHVLHPEKALKIDDSTHITITSLLARLNSLDSNKPTTSES